MKDWNPKDYLAFADERALPVHDLINRLSGMAPQVIVDLGCGPGNSSKYLQMAFPSARLSGLDASPAMIAQAQASLPGVSFAVQDITDWSPGNEDLVFSNALFQWVPNRDAHIHRILSAMKPGAVMALQMPDNLDEPSHRMMIETAKASAWNDRLATAMVDRSPLLGAGGYYDLLHGEAASLQLWRTTYHHRLAGHEGIVAMLHTTGLKPYLDRLDSLEQQAFLASYKARLVEHYPVQSDGKVLFAFPRMFVLAIRADNS